MCLGFVLFHWADISSVLHKCSNNFPFGGLDKKRQIHRICVLMVHFEISRLAYVRNRNGAH